MHTERQKEKKGKENTATAACSLSCALVSMNAPAIQVTQLNQTLPVKSLVFTGTHGESVVCLHIISTATGKEK